MRAGAVFFHIVIDQMAVTSREIITDLGQRPQCICKNFHLQGEVEQIVSQAIFTEAVGGILRIGIDTPLHRVTIVGRIKAGCNFSIGESDHRGFVQVVYDLRIQAVPVNRDGFEITFVQ